MFPLKYLLTTLLENKEEKKRRLKEEAEWKDQCERNERHERDVDKIRAQAHNTDRFTKY